MCPIIETGVAVTKAVSDIAAVAKVAEGIYKSLDEGELVEAIGNVAKAVVEKKVLNSLGDIKSPMKLPDASGAPRYTMKLPDAMNLEPTKIEQLLPSNIVPSVEEKMPQKELSTNEIAQKQDEVIKTVESGETPLETNMEKGNYGEMKVDQDLREKGYQRISEDAVSSLDGATHQGIDGVYYNPNGKPPYLIVDAKYNTAQLEENTNDGPQMSQTWIDKRLDAAVGKDKADEIRMAQLNGDVGCYVGHIAKGAGGEDLSAAISYDRVDGNGNIVEKDVEINAA